MILIINPSQKEHISLGLCAKTGGGISWHAYAEPNRELLSCIWDVLALHSLDKKDIQGIIVVVGAGSFTSTRIAVTVANTWGFAERIPLLALECKNLPNIQHTIPLLFSQQKRRFLSATYSGDPNITQSKKSKVNPNT